MSETNLSRRGLLKTLGIGLVAVPVLAACSKKGGGAAELKCTDTSSLTPMEANLRTAVAYVDKSPDPTKKCSGCAQFVASPNPDQCASCKLVKGPINPNGYCKSWAAKPA